VHFSRLPAFWKQTMREFDYSGVLQTDHLQLSIKR